MDFCNNTINSIVEHKRNVIFCVEKRIRFFLLLISAVGIALYFLLPGAVGYWCLICTIILAVMKEPGGAVASYLILSSLISSSYLSVIILGVLVFTFVSSNLKSTISKSLIIKMMLMLLVMIISYVGGYLSELNILLLAIICMILAVYIANYATMRDCGAIIFGFLLAAVTIVIVIAFQYLNGISVIKYGRLAFNGNIRTLANICIVPLFFLLGAIFEKRILFVWQNKTIQILEVLFLFIILLLTLSRGALLAVVVDLFFLILFNRKNKSKLLTILVIAIFVAIAFGLLAYNGTFRFNRLFADSNGGLNGRTDIWNFYYCEMKSRGLKGLLFGFGPGDIKRISSASAFSTMYSHSTFLDAFFSYGVIGFLTYISFFVSVGYRAIKSKRPFLYATFFSVIVAYLTHGVVFNIQLYTVVALVFSMMRKSGNINGGNNDSKQEGTL